MSYPVETKLVNNPEHPDTAMQLFIPEELGSSVAFHFPKTVKNYADYLDAIEQLGLSMVDYAKDCREQD